MRAGELNRRVTIEAPGETQDEAGQPIAGWVKVDDLWAGIANETGLGVIRSSLQGGVPTSIARYSFMVRFEAIRRLEINPGMRIVHDGLVFDIKGVTRDLKDRTKAFIITEQGGNSG